MSARRGSGTSQKRVRGPRERPLYTFTLSPEAASMLEVIAMSWGSSKSAAVERLIREANRRVNRR